MRRIEEDAVLQWVRRERTMQPKLGTLKLHARMREQGVFFRTGRDRLFKLLRDSDMPVERDPAQPRTTNSYHTLPMFTNRIAERPASAPNQVWLCDLTYIRTLEGFRYLFLISDQFSHKIVGHHLSAGMETKDALQALRKACESLPPGRRPCHHSDRGCQYCSHEYVDELHSRGLTASMTERNHCYENAQAERLNGIHKQEYGLGSTFPCAELARKSVDQAVCLYNTIRPHRSLGMDYPQKVHQRAAPRGRTTPLTDSTKQSALTRETTTLSQDWTSDRGNEP